MNPALTYRSAYLGLFAAQLLAVICNTYLDIQYGIFGTEVLIWSVVYAHSLRTGWKQRGVVSDGGRKIMRRYLIVGAIISLVMFMPMWGFPRAAIYMLAALQVSYNCITATRRQLHMSLLISLVLVIFAASHYRADWTMLFYLVPYLIAVVFTLVAEQVSRQSDDLQQASMSKQMVGGKMIAIASATIAILGVGLVLYVLTPQVTWVSLMWKWGNHSRLGLSGGPPAAINGGNSAAPSGRGEQVGQDLLETDGGRWLTPQEMRQAASRKGMPEWQRSVINQLADGTEWATATFKPIKQFLQDLWQAFKRWLHENWQQVIATLLKLSVLALLYALWRLMKEAKTVTWVKTRFDYLRLVLLQPQGESLSVAKRYYEAMGRLFELREMQRSALKNTREYQAEIDLFFSDLHTETAAMTLLFEEVRYGQRGVTSQQIRQMSAQYKRIFNTLN